MSGRTDIGDAIIAGIASGDTALEQMSEIVANLEKAGFAIVPREPAPEMLRAGFLADEGCEMPGQIYRAMIDQALTPQQF